MLHLKQGGDSGIALIYKNKEVRNIPEKNQIFIIHHQTYKYCEFMFPQSLLLGFISKKTWRLNLKHLHLSGFGGFFCC